MPGEGDILKINVDSSELDPALALLNKIDQKLSAIAKNTNVFSDMGKKGVKKLNEELKRTDNLLGQIFKKLKLSKLAAGIGGTLKSMATTLGIGGLMTVGGLFASAVMGAQGSVLSTMTAKRLGVGRPQYQALQYAGKQTGHSEEQLANTLMSMNEALRNPDKWGALFTATGLKAQDLQKKDPTQALFDIFDAIKNSPLAKRPETLSLLGENLAGIGINLDEFRDILKSGSSEYRQYFSEYLTKWGAKANWAKLDQGDRALIRFQTTLDIISKKVGGALAPAMEKALEALGPLLIKFGGILASLISKITPEDVERFGRAMAGFINIFTKLFAGWAPKKETSGSKGAINWLTKEPDSFKYGIANKAKSHAAIMRDRSVNIDTVNINVRNIPTASQVGQLTSGLKAQYATQ